MQVDFTFGSMFFSVLTLKRYFEILDLPKDRDGDIAYAAGTCISEDLKIAYDKFYNVENLEDVRLLEKVDGHLDQGIKPLDHTCILKVGTGDDKKVCNSKIKVGLDGGQALLLPFRQREIDVKSRIHFGNKGSN